MKVKLFIFTLICVFLGVLINKQNELIRVPKDERSLKETSNDIISGKISHINDGDSFVLNDSIKIRLYAIDAPELAQTCILNKEILQENGETISNTEEVKCGEDAKNKLAELTKQYTVSCLPKGIDAYDRTVAECYVEIKNRRTKKTDKVNINKEMVASGNAVAFLSFSDKYLDDENKAKHDNKGIWATTFDMPSVYRKKNHK